MNDLINLQLMMFLMMFAGLVLKKVGLIGNEGRANLTDLVLSFILPANIIKSFQIQFTFATLKSFALIFIISLLLQFGCVLFGEIVYKNTEPEKQKCLKYGIICSNAGFLGNPIAEGVFGGIGLTLASIYLIPQRIMMWSSGLSVFSGQTDKKAIIKKVLTHPCIIACEIGLFLMISQLQLPAFLNQTIASISSCNTAMSMLVIGVILADVDANSLFDKQVLIYSFFRLLFIPFLTYGACSLFFVDPLITGVSVLLAAMPAGATTSILASKYGADAEFATKMVVISTFLSLFTTAAWSLFLG
ncbi:MAG: malate permease [Clostridiales bacterium]|nr:malate permease [Clostridiales bacterium]